MNFKEILEATIKHKASDAFIVPGGPLRARVYSEVRTIDDYVFTNKDIEKFWNRPRRDLQPVWLIVIVTTPFDSTSFVIFNEIQNPITFTLAIEFYQGSPLLVLALFGLGGVMLCAYIMQE